MHISCTSGPGSTPGPPPGEGRAALDGLASAAPSIEAASTAPAAPQAEVSALGALPTIVRNAAHALVGLFTQPLGRSVDEQAMKGRDLSVQPDTRQKLAAGDLRGFWSARLGKDPVARVGLTLWGTDDDLEASISREGSEYWTPDMNVLSGLGVAVRSDLPADFPLPPTSDADLFTYWKWMGQVTHQRVIDSATDEGVLPTSASEAEQRAFARRVGEDLAKAHAAAVTADFASGRGAVPGLLGVGQIAEYHHEVFAALGLPSETYGGTPYAAIPDWLELRIAGGLYGHDADPDE